MTVKELVDNVTKFEMGSLGYCGNRKLIFEKNGDERTVRCEGFCSVSSPEKFDPRVLSKEEWEAFFTGIFGECEVMKYPREFESDCQFFDGVYWSMHIEFANRRAKNSGGYMVYPDNWDTLTKLLAEYDSFYGYED